MPNENAVAIWKHYSHGYRLLLKSEKIRVHAYNRIHADRRLQIFQSGHDHYPNDASEWPFYISISRRCNGNELTASDAKYMSELIEQFNANLELTGAEPTNSHSGEPGFDPFQIQGPIPDADIQEFNEAAQGYYAIDPTILERLMRMRCWQWMLSISSSNRYHHNRDSPVALDAVSTTPLPLGQRRICINLWRK